ncbi:uncharacterized protein LOC120713304 [Panicum virgatum]|uniref:Uncharacterized protein n=1 Tax=Panicum virgatum TaxID=38727 RepID=A0A8T0RB54_PANVG|nr:uncharacterized protein LOC120713304 [Panicum virgatum]KAG2582724.1 hypothetical protein PVAP13_6KG178100 [Panicum virgatum]
MAQAPRVAEALALFLSRAGVSALAVSSSATRHAVNRVAAAATSSAAGPSSSGWVVSVCTSDSILAALRTCIASAVRSAVCHAAASPSKGVPPRVLLLPPPRVSEPASLLYADAAAGTGAIDLLASAAEAVALFLSRAEVSAFAASSSATRRAVDRVAAAATSSAAGPSSSGWVVAVCNSDSVLAALRTYPASAVRRAVYHAAISPSNGAPPRVLLLPPPSATEPAPLLCADAAAGAGVGAIDPLESSSTMVLAAACSNCPPAIPFRSGLQLWGNGISYPFGFPVTGQGLPATPLGNSVVCILAVNWECVFASLPSDAEDPDTASPPPPPPRFVNSVSSRLVVAASTNALVPASYLSNHAGFARILRRSFTSIAHNQISSDGADDKFCSSPTQLQTVDDLITQMNEMAFNEEDKVKFKQAFYAKFRTLKTALGIAEFLEYQKYGYDEWLCILKVTYKKIGPHREAMDLQIKEDLSYSKEVEAEFTNDPGKALNAVKMDILLKWHEESRADLKKILGFCDPENKKMDWGTFVFFGRKIDVPKVLSIFKLFGF